MQCSLTSKLTKFLKIIMCLILIVLALIIIKNTCQLIYIGFKIVVSNFAPNYSEIDARTVNNTIYVTGKFDDGSYEIILDTFNSSPEPISKMVLESRGGLSSVGWKLGKLVEDYSLETEAIGTGCYSACTVPFIAGSTRYIAPSVQLGFHSSGFDNTVWDTHDNRILKEVVEETNLRLYNWYISHGMSHEVVVVLLDTPFNSMRNISGDWAVYYNIADVSERT